MKSKNFYYIKNIKTKNISYGFFSKNGGCSKNEFRSLNCSYLSGDKKENIKDNIFIAQKAINLNNKKIKIPQQIHSNIIKNVTKNNLKKTIIADGLYTFDKDIVLGILTADCAPVFIFNKRNKIICALHSGWKGALNNIAEKSIKCFTKNKSKTKEIEVIIGPCLSYKNFEVGLEFRNKFIKKNNNYDKFFKIKNKQKYFFNMRGLINYQFTKLGISNIHNIDMCTYSNASIFFSHRRSLHKNNLKNGRMINIIGFN